MLRMAGRRAEGNRPRRSRNGFGIAAGVLVVLGSSATWSRKTLHVARAQSFRLSIRGSKHPTRALERCLEERGKTGNRWPLSRGGYVSVYGMCGKMTL
jgi:hypothetical protein